MGIRPSPSPRDEAATRTMRTEAHLFFEIGVAHCLPPGLVKVGSAQVAVTPEQIAAARCAAVPVAAKRRGRIDVAEPYQRGPYQFVSSSIARG